MSKPLILIPCDVKRYGAYPFHCVGEKYVDAVAHGSNAMPMLLPAFGRGEELKSLSDHYDMDELLQRVHGVFVPGSVSNVHPRHYGQTIDTAASDSVLDEQRDEGVLPLIRRAIELCIPLFAVCRGLQELNVALGGTLHREVHNVEGFADHRENDTLPHEAQYEPSHQVTTTPGGRLHSLLNLQRFEVNSLHGQGIAKLGEQLQTEAIADDGLIEAVSLPEHWVLGVQWHPEWMFKANPVSARLFKAFGEAARAYAGTTPLSQNLKMSLRKG
jgi:putative glutamine amidotransferase